MSDEEYKVLRQAAIDMFDQLTGPKTSDVKLMEIAVVMAYKM